MNPGTDFRVGEFLKCIVPLSRRRVPGWHFLVLEFSFLVICHWFYKLFTDPGTDFRGGEFLKCIVFLRVFKVFCSFRILYSYREFAESLFY